MKFFFFMVLIASNCLYQNQKIKVSKLTKKYIWSLATEDVDYCMNNSEKLDSDFTKLKQVATTEELVYFTYNEFPMVRIYSFWALAERDYENIKRIFYEHKYDSTKVSDLLIGGCTLIDLGVNELMLASIRPKGSEMPINYQSSLCDKNCLNIKEYESLYSEISTIEKQLAVIR